MTYQSMANLAQDNDFRERVFSCCLEQALIFKDDGRPEFKNLANAIIGTPAAAQGVFTLVCVSPNFKEVTEPSGVPDIEILSAVQANWPVYGTVMFTPTPT